MNPETCIIIACAEIAIGLICAAKMVVISKAPASRASMIPPGKPSLKIVAMSPKNERSTSFVPLGRDRGGGAVGALAGAAAVSPSPPSTSTFPAALLAPGSAASRATSPPPAGQISESTESVCDATVTYLGTTQTKFVIQ